MLAFFVAFYVACSTCLGSVLDAGSCLACHRQQSSHPASVGFESFDSEIFNELSHIDTVTDFHLDGKYNGEYENMVSVLGDVIKEYGLEEMIGVANLHKHFDLEENEKMAFFMDKEHSTEKNGTDYSFYGIPVQPNSNKCTNDRLVPYIFRVSRNEDSYIWHPLQFICNNNNDNPGVLALEKFNNLIENGIFDDFFGVMGELILSNNFGNKIGLFWRYGNFVSHLKENKYLEKTFDNRMQIFEQINNIKGSHFPTQFVFEKEECYQNIFENEQNDKCRMVPPTACSRYCEWGPFKGHVTYHQRD